MLKRIRAAMGQRDETHQLSGIIEFNDSYFGGPTVGNALLECLTLAVGTSVRLS